MYRQWWSIVTATLIFLMIMRIPLLRQNMEKFGHRNWFSDMYLRFRENFLWSFFFTIVRSLWKNGFRFKLKVKDQFRKLRQRIQNKTYPVCNFGDHATCISYTMRNQPKAVQFSTGCLPSCHSREKRIDTIVVIRLKFKNNILLVLLTEIFLYDILYII